MNQSLSGKFNSSNSTFDQPITHEPELDVLVDWKTTFS